MWAAKVKESQEPEQEASPSSFRVRDFSKSIISPSPPEHLRLRIDIGRETLDGRAVFTLSPKNRKGSKHVLYLHGGSYVINATRQHWGFLTRLVEQSGCTVIAPDYPLAPAHSYAAAYVFLRRLYGTLIEKTDVSDIVLMGDSAGGGLALGFAMMLRDERFPPPAATVMLSPWLDVTLSNRYIGEVDPRDPFLNSSALRDAGRAWSHGANPRKPLISPIYGDLSELPPMHLFIGTKDIMIADCRRFRGLCMAAKAELNYYEFENMIHVWMLLPFKEARKAQRQIADIVVGVDNRSAN